MTYPNELKERVVVGMKIAGHGSQKTASLVLKVTSRTLRNWKKNHKHCKKRGRKAKEITFKETLSTVREWKRQGFCGVRPIIKALPQLRIRAVQTIIGELKSRKRKRLSIYKKQNQETVKINKVGGVNSIDGMLLKNGSECILSRDRASRKVKIKRCDDSLRAKDTIDFLQELKNKNELPLVLCTDNGSPFCNNEVEEFLDKNYIVHLKNLPRVPQHNGACEIAVREFKDVFNEFFDAEKTTNILNNNRLRGSLSWRSVTEFEKANFKEITLKERIEFFNETKQNIKKGLVGITNAKEKRKIERRAILNTMEAFGLATIIKGHPPAKSKAERIT